MLTQHDNVPLYRLTILRLIWCIYQTSKHILVATIWSVQTNLFFPVMVYFDGPRTWKEMFMILSFQMFSLLENKDCVLFLDTILQCITKEN